MGEATFWDADCVAVAVTPEVVIMVMLRVAVEELLLVADVPVVCSLAVVEEEAAAAADVPMMLAVLTWTVEESGEEEEEGGGSTVGQRAWTPLPAKKRPMRVVGSAEMPLQAWFMMVVCSCSAAAHAAEQGTLGGLKSELEQPLIGAS
jgi:hypothetical protein